MSVNRLFQIINILMEKETVTAPELAKQLEVSVRTIYRDIDSLSMAGIPVYTVQGKGGGISLLQHFVLNKALLSEQEQEQILMAVKSISPTSSEMDSLLLKMKALFHKADTNWIEVDLSSWYEDAESKEKFNILKDAVLQHRIISFSYTSGSGVLTKRIVKPAKLVFKSSSWYLQAYCLERQDYRTFKLSRISGLELTGGCFAETLSPPQIDNFSSVRSCVPIKLRISKTLGYRIYDEFDHRMVSTDPNGDLLLTIEMPEDTWLYGYLLSFGSALEVLEPEHIRRRLAEESQKILQKNQ